MEVICVICKEHFSTHEGYEVHTDGEKHKSNIEIYQHGMEHGVQIAAARLAAAEELAAILTRIRRADKSGNGGMVMGEAMLCKMLAELADSALARWQEANQ